MGVAETGAIGVAEIGVAGMRAVGVAMSAAISGPSEISMVRRMNMQNK